MIVAYAHVRTSDQSGEISFENGASTRNGKAGAHCVRSIQDRLSCLVMLVRVVKSSPE